MSSRLVSSSVPFGSRSDRHTCKKKGTVGSALRPARAPRQETFDTTANRPAPAVVASAAAGCTWLPSQFQARACWVFSQHVRSAQPLNVLDIASVIAPFGALLTTMSLQARCCCCCICGCSCCCRCRKVQCRVSSLRCLVCLSPLFFSHFSISASSAACWVSSTKSPSRACSAALLAARQTRRLPLALLMLDPSSIRIHHARLHHVVCLFDTSPSSYIQFLFSLSFLSPTHSSCDPPLSSSSRPPPPLRLYLCVLLFTRLLGSPFLSAIFTEPLLLTLFSLSPHLLSFSISCFSAFSLFFSSPVSSSSSPWPSARSPSRR